MSLKPFNLLKKDPRRLWEIFTTESDQLWSYFRRAFRWPDARYQRLSRISLAQWMCDHDRDILFQQVKWMGVTTVKNALDLWIYQEIIHEVQPEIILEIGSYQGGSTLFLAHMLDLIGHGQVISVDIDRSQWAVDHPRIMCVTGDSQSVEIITQVHELCRGRRVLFIHDGDHRMAAVLADLRAYAELVGLGSYTIVEDGHIDIFIPGDGIGHIRPGPLKAVKAFLKEDDRFVVDLSRERYLATSNPGGYLRRVK